MDRASGAHADMIIVGAIDHDLFFAFGIGAGKDRQDVSVFLELALAVDLEPELQTRNGLRLELFRSDFSGFEDGVGERWVPENDRRALALFAEPHRARGAASCASRRDWPSWSRPESRVEPRMSAIAPFSLIARSSWNGSSGRFSASPPPPPPRRKPPMAKAATTMRFLTSIEKSTSLPSLSPIGAPAKTTGASISSFDGSGLKTKKSSPETNGSVRHRAVLFDDELDLGALGLDRDGLERESLEKRRLAFDFFTKRFGARGFDVIGEILRRQTRLGTCGIASLHEIGSEKLHVSAELARQNPFHGVGNGIIRRLVLQFRFLHARYDDGREENAR